VTVLAALPAGTVAAPGPILVERRTLARFLAGAGWSWPVAGAVLVAALLWLVWVLARRRRERADADEPVVVGRDGARTGVASPPPLDVPPALIGTVLTGWADTQNVVAILVDLAGRGYLTIEPATPGAGPAGHWHAHRWRLRAARAPDESLRPYELTVLRGLFTDRSTLKLSELRHFGDTTDKACQEIYAELVARGWFARRPDRIRVRYGLFGGLGLVLGILLLILLGRIAQAGIVGLAVLGAAVVLIVGGFLMPTMTPAGVAQRRRALAFRRYLAGLDASRLSPQERPDVFGRYLPYAVVFGAVGAWISAFAGQGAASALGWHPSLGQDPGMFASSVDSFTSNVSSAVNGTTSSSGSSGFSSAGAAGGGAGSGAGGGGGSSW
jgi:uncharacterized protein (TIGR04222 family)